MEKLTLSYNDRQYFVEELTHLPGWRDGVPGERAILQGAGLPDSFTDHTTLTGVPTTDAQNTVSALEHFGHLNEREGYTALGALAEYVLKSTLHREGKQFCIEFIQKYQLIDNWTYQEERPPEPSQQQQQQGERNMIIELLTQTTVPVGVKFLFDRLAKIFDKRIEDDKKQQVEQKKGELEKAVQKIQNEQDVTQVQQLMQEVKALLPKDEEIDSLDAYVDWVKNQITVNFEYLPELCILTVRVLEERRQIEQNGMKKDKLGKMVAALQVQTQEFQDALELGDAGAREKRDLLNRATKALDLLQK